MEFSEGEHTLPPPPPPPPPPPYSLTSVYGNTSNEELPGYIFMCNGKTKTDCYRYRVFGIPKGRKDVIESIKPGMKLFLYDFEKRLLYGVYEATVGGRLNIEPEAFDKKYPAQVGFRIVKNCYPLHEKSFKSAIYENYNGSKFKQEISPYQVMSLLSLFRTFSSPELDLLPQRLVAASTAGVSRGEGLSFEERFIAATQRRNGLDHHSYSRQEQDPYANLGKEILRSLSNLNQPQQRLLGDPNLRSSIQDPQLKQLTILSNIRRYGIASENEYYPASEKDQFTSPYSDNKYYSSGNEHLSASAVNGSVYRSEVYALAEQREREASQQREINPARTYYHPGAPSVPNTTRSVQSHTETPAHSEAQQQATGAISYTHQPQSVASHYTTHSQPRTVEASRQSYAGTVSDQQQQQYKAAMEYYTQQVYAGGANGYTQQTHETTGYPQAQQPLDASATGYTQAQQQHVTAAGYTQQHQAVQAGYAQDPHTAATAYTQQQHQAVQPGYTQDPHAAATVYAQQYAAATNAYTQEPQAAASGYAQQYAAATNGYTQDPHTAATAYAQQYAAATNGYALEPQAAATGYVQQYGAAATGYALQPQTQTVVYATQQQSQAVGYTPQYYAQASAHAQQGVTQSSVSGAPGTTTDWNAGNQAYYSQTVDATATYNQTS